MAFYNPKTNDIWADSNIEGFLEDCVEIDEVIAPLIQELNKRGYRTRFCCSGHPLLACNEVFTDTANAENCIADVQSVEKTADPEYPYRVIVTPMENDFYISLIRNKKGISHSHCLPDLNGMVIPPFAIVIDTAIFIYFSLSGRWQQRGFTSGQHSCQRLL